MIKSRRMKWTGHVARMRESRNALGNRERKRPLGRCRWLDNIKMDLREIGWDGWIGSIWFRIGTGGGLL
jgi:hypothetical protein